MSRSAGQKMAFVSSSGEELETACSAAGKFRPPGRLAAGPQTGISMPGTSERGIEMAISEQVDSADKRGERYVGAELRDIYAKVRAQERLTFEDAVRLYQTPDLSAVGYMANLVRERLHGDRT